MKLIEKISRFAGNTFAFWVIFFAAIAYMIPNAFRGLAPFISLLLGIIMFGMGLTLTPKDFREIFRAPASVIIGVVAQFVIMPSLAWILATVFRVPPEVAVGIILVGCCPGGTASNVIPIWPGEIPLYRLLLLPVLRCSPLS